MSESSRTPTAADLAKYLSGESTSEEAARVVRWIGGDRGRRAQVERLRRGWEEARDIGPAWNVDRMWAAVSGRVDPSGARRLPALPSTPLAPRWFVPPRSSWFAVAAAAVLAVGVASIWFARPRAKTELGMAPMREVVTSAGQRAEVRLGDGSRVILGVDSRLRFPVALGARARELELFGQAYFEVQHDPNRPFRVRAGGVIVEDLGTEFVIRAYTGDSAVRVAVASGQVVVQREGNPAAPRTTLSRGDLGTLGGNGVAAVTHDVDLGGYLAWTTGRIEFQRTPLGEAARDLSRWFGVEFRLGDPALERVRVTASFRNEPITEVLHLLSASLSLRAERVGNVVTLWRK